MKNKGGINSLKYGLANQMLSVTLLVISSNENRLTGKGNIARTVMKICFLLFHVG